MPAGFTIDWSGTSATGLKTVYKDTVVTDLGAAFSLVGETPPDWQEAHAAAVRLLAPGSLEGVREALITALGAQLDFQSATADRHQYVGALVRSASQTACSRHDSFQKIVRQRPVPPFAPVLAVTYRPPMVPVGVSVNSKGAFTISVSRTIQTPIGTFSMSGSESYGPSKRLIIRDGSTERILLLDQPFRVFVPATYGVNVSNTSTDLILDVVPRPRPTG